MIRHEIRDITQDRMFIGVLSVLALFGVGTAVAMVLRVVLH